MSEWKRGRIVHVGEWDYTRDAPVGWIINDAPIGVQYFSDGRPPLVGGYTLEELRAIYENEEYGKLIS